MSFPNPDNYARDCECSATGSAPLPDDYFRTIPAPIVHIDASGAVPTLKVSYIPTNTRSTWLTSNTEVWVFAYKKAKYNGTPPAPTPQHRYGRFVHPVDTTRAATTSPFYGGGGGAVNGFTYHTEFPFLNGTTIPDPYVHVPLTGFSPLEFFRTRTDPGTAGTQRQVIEGDFPIAGTANSDQANYTFNKKLFNCYGYGSSYNGGKGGRTVKLQLRFVIPNPDTTSTKFNKIMGPPSDTIYCLPKYSNTAQTLVKVGSIDGIRITL